MHHHSPDLSPTSFYLSLYSLSLSFFQTIMAFIYFPSNFSQCFHHSLPLSLVPADGGKESRTPAQLSQTSCLPPPSAPLLRFPLLPHCSTEGWTQSRRILAQKPVQFPSPDSWCRAGPTQGSPRETQEHPFQTDRFTLNYETASFPHLPAVLAVPGGAATEVAQCRWCPQHPRPC